MSFLLPWFPILLGAALGGRMLGRGRGFVLGLICATFWIVLVQASVSKALFSDPLGAAMCLAGALAIITIAGWAGETLEREHDPAESASTSHASATGTVATTATATEPRESLRVITEVLEQFDGWLADHGGSENSWPSFDEWIRSTLNRTCHATHVRPLRLVHDMERLLPLQSSDPFSDVPELSARKGVAGYVVTTGRAFVSGDAVGADFLDQLDQNDSAQIDWCFPIRRGSRRLGVVTVGHIGLDPVGDRGLLKCIGSVVSQCWFMVQAECDSRSASVDDPVSGLHVRRAFLDEAERSLTASYADGEPVAAVVIALEGLRHLTDLGKWEVAEELLRSCASELRRKVRMDDRIGRFDGERFVILLRRVDSELAELIVRQLLDRVEKVCGDVHRWGTRVQVRCGLVGSGLATPDLRTLLSGALQRCHRARTTDCLLSSDLAYDAVATGGPA